MPEAKWDFTEPHRDHRFRGIERRFVWTILAGFGVVLVMMVTSGAIALRAMEQIDREADAVSARFLRDTQLVDRLVRQQANLGVLIHSLAGATDRGAMDRAAREFTLERTRTLGVIDEASKENLHDGERAAWKSVESAAEPLFAEIGLLLAGKQQDRAALSRHYAAFTAAANRLMEAAYDDAASSRTAQRSLDAGLFDSALRLFLTALALAGVCAAISVAGSIAWFHRMETQAATLARLSLHTLREQEQTARRFSREMHDEFGQLLNAVESSLTVVKADGPESVERLRDAVALIKEAQGTAREMSQLLRPRILDDFGLDAGLRELARGFSQRTGVVVDFRSHVRDRLRPLIETHLFRIAQEALTNAFRHSSATTVWLSLDREKDRLVLTIRDNGQGFDTRTSSRKPGVGLLGIGERARACGGSVSVTSAPGSGVTVTVRVPFETEPSEEDDYLA